MGQNESMNKNKLSKFKSKIFFLTNKIISFLLK